MCLGGKFFHLKIFPLQTYDKLADHKHAVVINVRPDNNPFSTVIRKVSHFVRRTANQKFIREQQRLLGQTPSTFYNDPSPGRRFLKTVPSDRGFTKGASTASSTGMSKRRRLTFHRFNGRKRFKSASGVARLALSKVRNLERKREVKMVDLAATIASVGSSGDVRSLADIGQGDLFDKRDGDHVSPFKLELRLQWAGVAAAEIEVYRTIILRDRRQVTSAIPALTDVLVSGSPLAMFRASTRTRWKILYDQTFTRPSDTSSRQSFVINLSIRLNLLLGFEGSGAASWNKNGLFMVNVSGAATNLPAVIFRSRVLYND